MTSTPGAKHRRRKGNRVILQRVYEGRFEENSARKWLRSTYVIVPRNGYDKLAHPLSQLYLPLGDVNGYGTMYVVFLFSTNDDLFGESNVSKFDFA